MPEFGAHVEAWHDFFTLAGGASATLLGLLFVGVSLQAEFRSLPPDSYIRSVAALSFQNFLIVILFALYFLAPDPSPKSIAWPVILTALFPFVSHLRMAMRQLPGFAADRSTYVWHFVVPAISHLAAVGVGIALLRGADDAIGWMVAVIAFLLMIPTRNAWELVISPDNTPVE